MNNLLKKALLLFIFINIFHTVNAEMTRREVVAKLYKAIEKWYGTNYILGGESKTGTDCSGFTSTLYKEVFNIELPRKVAGQKNKGKIVKAPFQPGDLLFFIIDGKIGHVGIYLFDNKFVHAASSGPKTGVVKSSLEESYYKKRFAFARRFVDLPAYNHQTVEEIKAEIFLAKDLYKGKCFNFTDKFESDMPIFVLTSFEKLNKGNFYLIIKNGRNIIQKFNIRPSGKSTFFNSVILSKGYYNIVLMTDRNKVLQEKIILVK